MCGTGDDLDVVKPDRNVIGLPAPTPHPRQVRGGSDELSHPRQRERGRGKWGEEEASGERGDGKASRA